MVRGITTILATSGIVCFFLAKSVVTPLESDARERTVATVGYAVQNLP